jgi:hypothetical protein
MTMKKYRFWLKHRESSSVETVGWVDITWPECVTREDWKALCDRADQYCDKRNAQTKEGINAWDTPVEYKLWLKEQPQVEAKPQGRKGSVRRYEESAI